MAMASIYWYSLLAIVGLVIAAFTIYKRRDVAKLSNFLVFFLFATCVTWIGEFTVLGLFDSYAYKTGIFSSPWAQNLLGHLIFNSTLLSLLWARAYLCTWISYSLRRGGIYSTQR